MSSYPVSFHKLIQSQFPNLSLRQSALCALISVFADRDDVSAEEWLEQCVRRALVELAPETVRSAYADGKYVSYANLTWHDWRAMSDADLLNLPRGELSDAAKALRPQIEALLAKRDVVLPPLDRRRVPQNRRHKLFDSSKVVKIADKEEADKKAYIDRLHASGSEREIPRVTNATIRRVEHLLASVPNMREVTHFALGQLALSRRDSNRLSLPPILLVGPPAAGKTWWAEELARAIGVRSELLPMGAVSSSWELSGASVAWNRARPGRILRAFIDIAAASPIFVLDEIDKISSGNYDPAPALLHLIEPLTSARFRDEFFDAEFDVSRSIFIATANDAGRMDPALRSRFREFIVRTPAREQREPIVASLWQSIRREHPSLMLQRSLSTEVMAILVDRFRDARQVRRLIEDGLGRAAQRAEPLQLRTSDVGGSLVSLVRRLTQSNNAPSLEPQP